jgi:hypothetical protein
MKRLPFIVMLLALIGCTDEANTKRTLESAGYTDIETTGFRAKNTRGKVVTGTVCCGIWSKGCMIRY